MERELVRVTNRLLRRFERMERNQDGTLSRDQIKDIILPEVKQFYKRLERDLNDYGEFVNELIAESVGIIRPLWKEMKKNFDRKNHSQLYAKELKFEKRVTNTLCAILAGLKMYQAMSVEVGWEFVSELFTETFLQVRRLSRQLELVSDSDQSSIDNDSDSSEEGTIPEEEDDLDAPEEYTDPVYKRLLVDPVKASDGLTYERSELQARQFISIINRTVVTIHDDVEMANNIEVFRLMNIRVEIFQ